MANHEHAPTHHVTPLWVYFSVFFALAIGTVLTVWASRVDLGWANTPIALVIATVKAVLVILFFMHVIHSTRLTWVVVIGSFLWLGVLFVLTFTDYLTRGWALY
ncbi:MAG TPA: cytochrome C oxidase subunit IV family protein [Thermoanaerobaculia bacterium]|nr:cytochrome C oxidase subunit IV family protein [Thermoanaerobaculia bacterium]